MNNEIIALEINRKIFLLISIEAFLKSRGAPLTMMKYNKRFHTGNFIFEIKDTATCKIIPCVNALLLNIHFIYSLCERTSYYEILNEQSNLHEWSRFPNCYFILKF